MTMKQDIASMLRANEIKVPHNLKAFAGHFENNPIVPGIYSLELAVLCLSQKLQSEIVLQKVNRCKFVSPLLPGMELKVQVNLISRTDNMQKAKIQFLASSEVVVDVNIVVEVMSKG